MKRGSCGPTAFRGVRNRQFPDSARISDPARRGTERRSPESRRREFSGLTRVSVRVLQEFRRRFGTLTP